MEDQGDLSSVFLDRCRVRMTKVDGNSFELTVHNPVNHVQVGVTLTRAEARQLVNLMRVLLDAPDGIEPAEKQPRRLGKERSR